MVIVSTTHLSTNPPSMQKLFLLVIAFCCTLINYAQVDIKTYVAENTVQVKTIEPDATDYTDLASVGNAIGNAGIVMLGEQDHGDGATFLAKTRLIRYLHEKKGFNVIAFESGRLMGWAHSGTRPLTGIAYSIRSSREQVGVARRLS